MHVHCSACGAPIPQGAKFCPSCALPLTALAVPTPAPQRKRVSLLAILAACFGIFWVIAYASDEHQKEQRDAALAAFTADIKAGGKLTTPEAFQARCGNAQKLALQPGETVLAYDDLRIHFRAGQPVDLRRVTSGRWQQPLGEDFVFDQLQCKGAR